jgi:hypothetical protein
MVQLDTRSDVQQRPADAQPARPHRLAGWGLALAILTLGGVGSVLGIVFGVRARRQAQESGGRGAGLAMAAIVVGIVTFIGAVAYWILIAQHVGGSGGGGGGGGGGY